jgi:hypothetical protein
MDIIVKQELWRGIPIFFISLFVTSYILINLDLPTNIFSVLGIPLLITFIIFFHINLL